MTEARPLSGHKGRLREDAPTGRPSGIEPDNWEILDGCATLAPYVGYEDQHREDYGATHSSLVGELEELGVVPEAEARRIIDREIHRIAETRKR